MISSCVVNLKGNERQSHFVLICHARNTSNIVVKKFSLIWWIVKFFRLCYCLAARVSSQQGEESSKKGKLEILSISYMNRERLTLRDQNITNLNKISDEKRQFSQ